MPKYLYRLHNRTVPVRDADGAVTGHEAHLCAEVNIPDVLPPGASIDVAFDQIDEQGRRGTHYIGITIGADGVAELLAFCDDEDGGGDPATGPADELRNVLPDDPDTLARVRSMRDDAAAAGAPFADEGACEGPDGLRCGVCMECISSGMWHTDPDDAPTEERPGTLH